MGKRMKCHQFRQNQWGRRDLSEWKEKKNDTLSIWITSTREKRSEWMERKKERHAIKYKMMRLWNYLQLTGKKVNSKLEFHILSNIGNNNQRDNNHLNLARLGATEYHVIGCKQTCYLATSWSSPHFVLCLSQPYLLFQEGTNYSYYDHRGYTFIL